MTPPPDYTTKGWKRGKDSHATTVPREIMAMVAAPRDNFEVEWYVELGMGEVDITVEVVERDSNE